MANITVLDKKGKTAGTIELNPEVFGCKINKRLLDMVTRMFSLNKRTGTAHTKTRAEVRGGGKRPWRQKGTGRARASSIRSPLWRGGGTTFGPRKREIYYDIPKQLRSKALAVALSKKLKDEKLIIIDDLSINNPKTKEVADVLKNVKVASKKTLMVISEMTEKVDRATRNIATLSVSRVQDVNAYNVMRKNVLIIDKKAVSELEKRVLESKSRKKELV